MCSQGGTTLRARRRPVSPKPRQGVKTFGTRPCQALAAHPRSLFPPEPLVAVFLAGAPVSSAAHGAGRVWTKKQCAAPALPTWADVCTWGKRRLLPVFNETMRRRQKTC
jgi:hypothetical protein